MGRQEAVASRVPAELNLYRQHRLLLGLGMVAAAVVGAWYLFVCPRYALVLVPFALGCAALGRVVPRPVRRDSVPVRPMCSSPSTPWWQPVTPG